MQKDVADAIDLAGDRQVPALALTLLGASVAETQRLTNSLLDSKDRELKKLRQKVRKQEDDSYVVSQLHAMLDNPRYARRLLRLLVDCGPLEGKDFEEVEE